MTTKGETLSALSAADSNSVTYVDPPACPKCNGYHNGDCPRMPRDPALLAENADLREKLSSLERERQAERRDSEDWMKRALDGEEKLSTHLTHVEQFLKDMYATMIDPCEQPPMKVAKMCALLLKTAVEQREQANEYAGMGEKLSTAERKLAVAEKEWAAEIEASKAAEAELARVREALRSDPTLLLQVADYMNQLGSGPMEDRLRLMHDTFEAALRTGGEPK